MATSTLEIPAPVSTKFCYDHVDKFSVEKFALTQYSSRFTAKYSEERTLFQIEHKKTNHRNSTYTVCDSMERPLVQVSKKLGEWRPTWEAIRANGDQQPVFVMKKSNLNPLNKNFDVFLGTNISMSRPDFTIKRDFFSNNYTICYKDKPIAQVSVPPSFSLFSGLLCVPFLSNQ
ncbi:hypothetical protein AXG93_3255s1150 [Marchantia polymorpha subsp. ruderalis]|uniref:Tubby C-terminal domain-containing protein n=1 Tax=Marchantia polymorpha subsp. ruderalis TaxID=1480154 RepID=A0A176VSJ8_MARPO|nr:hypothetical protein AXG93_3255s1150 [Marchantia polymorpha subsp. ruderalis]